MVKDVKRKTKKEVAVVQSSGEVAVIHPAIGSMLELYMQMLHGKAIVLDGQYAWYGRGSSPSSQRLSNQSAYRQCRVYFPHSSLPDVELHTVKQLLKGKFKIIPALRSHEKQIEKLTRSVWWLMQDAG